MAQKDMRSVGELLDFAGYDIKSKEGQRIRWHVRKLEHGFIDAKAGRYNKLMCCTPEVFREAMKRANLPFRGNEPLPQEAPTSGISPAPAPASPVTLQADMDIAGYVAILREAAESIGIPDNQITPARLNAAVRDRFGIDVINTLRIPLALCGKD